MKMHKVFELDKTEAFKQKAAILFLSLINDALEKRGVACVALSGGTTPIPIFNLIKNKFKDRVNWKNVSVFWVDERCVPPSHPDSNYGNASKNLLNSLKGIKTFRLKGELEPVEAANQYKHYLESHVPIRKGVPYFDLIWLGMGNDGHTASIFPGTPIIKEREEWVKSMWVEKIESHRLTLTLPVINNARNRMIVIKGLEKKELFNEIKTLDEKKYPIQYLQPSHAIDYWVIN